MDPCEALLVSPRGCAQVFVGVYCVPIGGYEPRMSPQAVTAGDMLSPTAPRRVSRGRCSPKLESKERDRRSWKGGQGPTVDFLPSFRALCM